MKYYNLVICCLIPVLLMSQEISESAEVSLEPYTDEFQECFFEALKQKGIENYDKAINELLKCKGLGEAEAVIDHELAKAFLANRQAVMAEEYAIASLNAEPGNPWYLETLYLVLLKQGRTIEMIKEKIPAKNSSLTENLAMLYYRYKQYTQALEILKETRNRAFTKSLEQKIRDSMIGSKSDPSPPNVQNTIVENNQYEQIKAELEKLLAGEKYSELGTMASEALESYPLQPFFYYCKGVALRKDGRNKEAISILESALDYLIDERELANKIYSDLSAAYKAIGNTSKANMYLSKIKSGS